MNAHYTYNVVPHKPSKPVVSFHQSSLVFLEKKSSLCCLKNSRKSTRPSLKRSSWRIPDTEYTPPTTGIFTLGFFFYYYFENAIPENSKAFKLVLMTNIRYKNRLKGIISIIPVASVILSCHTKKEMIIQQTVRKYKTHCKNPLTKGNSLCERCCVRALTLPDMPQNGNQNVMLSFTMEETCKTEFISCYHY